MHLYLHVLYVAMKQPQYLYLGLIGAFRGLLHFIALLFPLSVRLHHSAQEGALILEPIRGQDYDIKQG